MGERVVETSREKERARLKTWIGGHCALFSVRFDPAFVYTIERKPSSEASAAVGKREIRSREEGITLGDRDILRA